MVHDRTDPTIRKSWASQVASRYTLIFWTHRPSSSPGRKSRTCHTAYRHPQKSAVSLLKLILNMESGQPLHIKWVRCVHYFAPRLAVTKYLGLTLAPASQLALNRCGRWICSISELFCTFSKTEPRDFVGWRKRRFLERRHSLFQSETGTNFHTKIMKGAHIWFHVFKTETLETPTYSIFLHI